MNTQLNLDEIRARAEAATPGPWGVGNHTTVASEMEQLEPGHTRYRYWIADLDDFNRDEADYPNPVEPAADAAFIAHARQDIPALLVEVERLRAKLAEQCGSCHPCTNWADETWRRAARKPPTVQRWDDVMAELAETRTQRDAAKTIANELRDNLAAADEISANLQQHIAAIRAEATE